MASDLRTREGTLGSGGITVGDVLPPDDGVGVSPPAVKMPSMSDHRVSDSFRHSIELIGPFKARSMIWCESAIAPQRART